MKREWSEHLDALSRANAWEAAHRPPLDFSSALAWLSEAWILAERHGPRDDPEARRARHLEELLHLRRQLERARLMR